MPGSLVLLLVMALVLHIVFQYFLPPYPWPSSAVAPRPSFARSLLALFVIVLILLFWFVIPVRIGPGLVLLLKL